ncbi:MAG: DNA repair protein RecO [Phycisphaerae bacterium]
MPVRTDQAVVLRLSDYSETSQIVSLFTASSGLVRLIAKGSRRGTRKRFAPGLDLLEYGEVSYAPPRGDAGLGTLAEWVQRDPFTGLRRELLRQYAGLYAVELVSQLTEEYDPHPALFNALLELLQRLAVGETDPRPAPQAPAGPTAALVRFQGALLEAIGYAPNLRRCVGCGRPRIRGTHAYFSSSAGGLICRDCEMHHAEKRRIPPAMLGADPEAQYAADWFGLLDYHLTDIAGRAFKTADRLRSLLANPRAELRDS